MQLPNRRELGKREVSGEASNTTAGEMGRWASKALEDGMKSRRLPTWLGTGVSSKQVGAGASSNQGKPRNDHHSFIIRAL